MSSIHTKKVNRYLQFNSTRKKNRKNNGSKYSIKYSEDFIRRLTEPFSFTVVTLTNEKQQQLDEKYGRILSDEEKMDKFMKENS